MGMLYKIESPDFEPVDYPPLSFAVIGSGSDASEDLQAYELPLATAHPNRTASWFIDALTGFLHRTEETTVGGWILGAELINGKVLSLGYQYDPTGQNRQVGIRIRDGRFILDAGQGREIILLYPSEIIGHSPQKPVDVLRNFSSTETDRRAKLLDQLRPYHPSSRK